MIGCRESLGQRVDAEYEYYRRWCMDLGDDVNTALAFQRLPELQALDHVLPLQLGFFLVRMKAINDLLWGDTWHPNLLDMVRKTGHWSLFESDLALHEFVSVLSSVPLDVLRLILTFDECRDPHLPLKRLLSK